MRAVRGTDRDDALHAIREAVAERERDHATVRRADRCAQPVDAELVQQATDRGRLVARRDQRPGLAGAWP